jgi:anti-anti-sigma factor
MVSMTVTTSQLWVAKADSVVFLKISGRADFTLSVNFKRLADHLRRQGRRQFVFDLTDCQIMDSTFLGVLSGLSLQMAKAGPSSSPGSVQLLNPNARVLDLLDNLGIVPLFQIQSAVAPLARYEQTTSAEVSGTELVRTSLEAHQTLMALNPDNIPKFQEVTQFLAEDLKRLDENTAS